MTLKEFTDIVYRLSYKPGTRFSLDVKETHLVFHIMMPAVNAKNPTEKSYINFVKAISPIQILEMDQKKALDWIRFAVFLMEEHEMDEFLLYDGENIRDPHPPTQKGFLERIAEKLKKK